MVSCSFEFDSQTWEQQYSVEVEDHWNWSCPYEALDDWDRCIFHLHPPERQASNLSEDDLRDAFIEQVLRGDHNRLHGASFDEVQLSFLSLENQADRPINLMANKFETLSFSDAYVSVAIRLAYSEISTLDLRHTVFERPLDIQRTTITEKIDAVMADLERVYAGGAYIERCNLQEAVIDRIGLMSAEIGVLNCMYAKLSPILDEVTVTDEINLEDAHITRGIQCRGATFYCSFDIEDTTVEGNVRLENTDFLSDFIIRRSTFEGVGLKGAEIEGRVDISDSRMEELILDGATLHERIVISGVFRKRLRMNDPTIDGDLLIHSISADNCLLRKLDIEAASISSESISDLKIFTSNIDHLQIGEGRIESLAFDGTTVGYFSTLGSDIGSIIQFDGERHKHLEQNYWGKARFQNSEIESLKWRGDPVSQASHIEFIDGDVEVAELEQPNNGAFIYSFMRTKLGSIEANNPDGDDLYYVHFLQTNFDGFPFQDYTEELSPDWKLNQGPGINRRSFEQTPLEDYQTYQSARADAENSNQEDARSGLYLREMEKRTKVLRKRAKENRDRKAILRLYEIKLLDWICGYGEEPGKPVFWASGIIFLFGLLYSTLMIGKEKAVVESLVSGFTLSLQSFATLVFGVNPEMTGTTLRFMTSVEGALSTLLIPFLVFSLTKSID